MEGMASYMAKDESTSDKMYLRDAVVNDSIPSILERGASGFLAYRFGHAVFDFIEERWGKEGFRDFLFEFRNTFGGRADRAVERSFRIDAEDFDLDFRRWLRKKYLPQLVETGEPSDFGRPFRDDKGEIQQVLSPAASPSGDLVAALAVTRGDLDIVLFDTRTRRAITNLTKGFTGSYEYLGAQFLTIGRAHGPRHRLLGRRQLHRRLRQARTRAEPADFRRPRPQAGEDDRDGGRAADESGLQPRRAYGRLLRQPRRPVRHLHRRPRNPSGVECDRRRDLRRRAGLLARRRVDRLQLGGR